MDATRIPQRGDEVAIPVGPDNEWIGVIHAYINGIVFVFAQAVECIGLHHDRYFEFYRDDMSWHESPGFWAPLELTDA